MAEIKAFEDISSKGLPQKEGVAGMDYLNRVSSMQVGFGSEGFFVDKQGIWLGSKSFTSAPIALGMDGSIAALTITANEISGDQLDVLATKTGTLTVDETITVGTTAGRVLIDGANKRILINDGTNNRVVLGDL